MLIIHGGKESLLRYMRGAIEARKRTEARLVRVFGPDRARHILQRHGRLQSARLRQENPQIFRPA